LALWPGAFQGGRQGFKTVSQQEGRGKHLAGNVAAKEGKEEKKERSRNQLDEKERERIQGGKVRNQIANLKKETELPVGQTLTGP